MGFLWMGCTPSKLGRNGRAGRRGGHGIGLLSIYNRQVSSKRIYTPEARGLGEVTGFFRYSVRPFLSWGYQGLPRSALRLSWVQRANKLLVGAPRAPNWDNFGCIFVFCSKECIQYLIAFLMHLRFHFETCFVSILGNLGKFFRYMDFGILSGVPKLHFHNTSTQRQVFSTSVKIDARDVCQMCLQQSAKRNQ